MNHVGVVHPSQFTIYGHSRVLYGYNKSIAEGDDMVLLYIHGDPGSISACAPVPTRVLILNKSKFNQRRL